MDEHLRQLTDYVSEQLKNGVAEEHIRQILLQHNWDAALVDKAFLSITPTAPVHASTDIHTQTNTPDTQINTDNSTPKYKVFQAIADTFRAMHNNLKTFLLTFVLSYVAVLMIMLILGLLLSQVLHGVQLFLMSIFVFIIWNALATAFLIATTSIALYDGSQNRKSTFVAVFSEGIAKLGRIVTTNLLLCIVIFLPFIFTIFLPVIVAGGDSNNSPASLLLLSISMIVSVIWLCISLVRFALAPYVALFEPNVSILKTLSRSKHLLAKGGQWFLIKGFILYVFVMIVLSLVTGQNAMGVADSNNVIVVLITIIVSAVGNGALVMLYINRKKLRG